MARSWREWFTGKTSENWDRRSRSAPDSPPLEMGDLDPLTGTLHWVRFMAVLNTIQEQAPGAILVVDLDDRSTSINSIAGDDQADVLPWLAQAVRQAIRADDLVAHLQDYRFAVLLRGADQQMAGTVAARIQESVYDTLFMTAGGIVRLSVAVGGVTLLPEGDKQHDLVAAALDNLSAARSSEGHVLIQ